MFDRYAWASAHDIIPILGARTKEQLENNLAASSVKLSTALSTDQIGWMKSALSRLDFRMMLWPESLFGRE